MLGQDITTWAGEHGRPEQYPPFFRLLLWRIKFLILFAAPARLQLYYAKKTYPRKRTPVVSKEGKFLKAADTGWEFIRISALEDKTDLEPSCLACIRADGKPWDPNVFPGVICEHGWLCKCQVAGIHIEHRGGAGLRETKNLDRIAKKKARLLGVTVPCPSCREPMLVGTSMCPHCKSHFIHPELY